MPFKPVCFVVMPFGVKETGAAPPHPASIDFDQLWRFAIRPALEDLGHHAVRADEDRSALIIHEMIERLYYSDLVVADISIANANVYYEIGLRHAARLHGCVLIAANWSKPLFDVQQMRRVVYDNADPVVDAAVGQRIRNELVQGIAGAIDERTPPSIIIPGLGTATPPDQRQRSQALAKELEDFDRLHHTMRAVLEAPRDSRISRTEQLLAAHPAQNVRSAYVAAALVEFARDGLNGRKDSEGRPNDWKGTLDYIDALPESVRQMEYLQEQRALALAKSGDIEDAIANLRWLIERAGSTPEREGLLGGRYKSQYRAFKAAGDNSSAMRALERAIRHYERGMMLDLNEFYCSCNLPALYRDRNSPEDEARARETAMLALAACRRHRDLGLKDDGWIRPTLLGMAFATHHPDAAESVLREIEREDVAAWRLDTTLSDLEAHIAQIGEHATPAITARFAQIVHTLKKLSGE